MLTSKPKPPPALTVTYIFALVVTATITHAPLNAGVRIFTGRDDEKYGEAAC